MTLEEQIDQAVEIVKHSIWRYDFYRQQKNPSKAQQEQNLQSRANMCWSLREAIRTIDLPILDRLREQQERCREKNEAAVPYDAIHNVILDNLATIAMIFEAYEGVNPTREYLPSLVAARQLRAICDDHGVRVARGSAEAEQIAEIIKAKSELKASVRTIVEKAAAI